MGLLLIPDSGRDTAAALPKEQLCTANSTSFYALFLFTFLALIVLFKKKSIFPIPSWFSRRRKRGKSPFPYVMKSRIERTTLRPRSSQRTKIRGWGPRYFECGYCILFGANNAWPVCSYRSHLRWKNVGLGLMGLASTLPCLAKSSNVKFQLPNDRPRPCTADYPRSVATQILPDVPAIAFLPSISTQDRFSPRRVVHVPSGPSPTRHAWF